MNSLSLSLVNELENTVPMRHQSLAVWLQWQEGLHFSAIDLDLERCREVAGRMGLLRPKYKVVSIAGTNGKGSSAAMLESILTASGYKIGAYTSPHLLRYNERIRVNGVEVSDEALCRSFHRVDLARQDISLTYFEFGTLAALDIFYSNEIDLAVLEVGLGGRLDAVNILDADVALLCSIDLDHENWLGTDRESIGFEKAGIFRTAKPAVCADPRPPASVATQAKEIAAELYLAGRDFSWQDDGSVWHWQSALTQRRDLPVPGRYDKYQIQNAAGVLKVLEVLSKQFSVKPQVIDACLRDFRLPGRFQIVPGEVCWVLDVAHNRQAAAGLVQNLLKLPGQEGKKHLIIGMLEDKQHELVFSELSNVADFWYVVSLNGERGTDALSLAEKLSSAGHTDNVNIFEEINMAFGHVHNLAQAGDTVIVTGSFLTVAAAVKWLDVENR